MKIGYRIYGEINGLNEAIAKRFCQSLPFQDIRFENETLFFEHEGLLFDTLDHHFSEIVNSLNYDGSGWIEVIDNEAWTLDRYTLTCGNISVQHIKVDDYLDRYRYYE